MTPLLKSQIENEDGEREDEEDVGEGDSGQGVPANYGLRALYLIERIGGDYVWMGVVSKVD